MSALCSHAASCSLLSQHGDIMSSSPTFVWCPPSGCWAVYPTKLPETTVPLSGDCDHAYGWVTLPLYRGPSHGRHHVYDHQKCISQIRSLLWWANEKELGIENGFYRKKWCPGQRIGAFVHEEESTWLILARWHEQLFESSYLASRYANVLMPILGNLGNVFFCVALLWSVDSLPVIVGGLTVGGLMAFLQWTVPTVLLLRSQQLNFVLMALERPYLDLLDEPEEVDQGKLWSTLTYR